MIDPANPVQYGHYPKIVEDADSRSDSCGPHFSADEQEDEMVSFTVPDDWITGTSVQLNFK